MNCAARNQLDRDRAAAEKGESEASATLSAELNAARDKISALTTSLLSRTEELRTLDSRRAEVATELELARAREKEFKTALDEHKQSGRTRRGALEGRAAATPRAARAPRGSDRCRGTNYASCGTACAVAPPQPTVGYTTAQAAARANPVLGSIVQQFDKLRQQRASDRHSANKPR